MTISAADVKKLREISGVGMMDCKTALTETAGDIDKAMIWLREKGLAKAAKKSARTAAEGVVDAYIHAGGKIGVLVEVNCETDFVANTDGFRGLAHDIALHIAASNPTYLRREDVPEAVLEQERSIVKVQLQEQGKPEAIWEKIIAGRIEKFYSEVCLLEQSFVKDPDKTIEKLRQEKVAEIGENIQIRRFVRFQLGEGIEKETTDLAAEVAKTLGQG